MEGFTQILEQARRFAEQHVPTEALSASVPTALLLISAGVVLGVLGARLIRPLLAVAFGAAGAFAAGRLACAQGLPVPVLAILGAALAGGLGYLLHRLWVGVGVGMLLAVVALSVFGYHRVLPEVVEYQQVTVVTGVDGVAEFVLPEPPAEGGVVGPGPEQWARDFWAHLTRRHSDVNRQVAAIGTAAALLGLLVGTLATRFALIVSTALVGTSLVASGAALLTAEVFPTVYQSALEQPRMLYGAGGGLLLISVVLQAMLNRRPPQQPALEPAR